MKQTWQLSSYEYCFVFGKSWVRSQKVGCRFSGFTRSSQKVLGITWFVTQWDHSFLAECYWLFLRASFAEEAALQVVGKDSGFCMTITHRATHRLWYSNSSQSKTVLSSPNHRTLRSCSEWLLALPCSENGAQGDTLLNHGVNEIDVTAELQKIPKEAG
jgi:hypothetical protein